MYIAIFTTVFITAIVGFYILMVKENQEYKKQELSKKELKDYLKKGIVK